ncbi:MAG: hypothetical protein WCS37_18380 [Chloroflexota bacterium]|nr:hypothetical protein [Chloroflexota bacterium]
MSVSESLEKLGDILDIKSPTLRQHLQPGLTRAEVQAALSPHGITPPEELYELYGWYNGTNDRFGHGSVFGDHQFLPFDEAVELYQRVKKGHCEINLEKCFPFASYFGEICAIYCDPTPVLGFQYPIIKIFHTKVLYYENLDLMIQTVTEWFASGIYETVESLNSPLKGEIMRRINSRLPYPNHVFICYTSKSAT